MAGHLYVILELDHSKIKDLLEKTIIRKSAKEFPS
jgi:hypothetical protein